MRNNLVGAACKKYKYSQCQWNIYADVFFTQALKCIDEVVSGAIQKNR